MAFISTSICEGGPHKCCLRRHPTPAMHPRPTKGRRGATRPQLQGHGGEEQGGLQAHRHDDHRLLRQLHQAAARAGREGLAEGVTPHLPPMQFPGFLASPGRSPPPWTAPVRSMSWPWSHGRSGKGPPLPPLWRDNPPPPMEDPGLSIGSVAGNVQRSHFFWFLETDRCHPKIIIFSGFGGFGGSHQM